MLLMGYLTFCVTHDKYGCVLDNQLIEKFKLLERVV